MTLLIPAGNGASTDGDRLNWPSARLSETAPPEQAGEPTSTPWVRVALKVHWTINVSAPAGRVREAALGQVIVGGVVSREITRMVQVAGCPKRSTVEKLERVSDSPGSTKRNWVRVILPLLLLKTGKVI